MYSAASPWAVALIARGTTMQIAFIHQPWPFLDVRRYRPAMAAPIANSKPGDSGKEKLDTETHKCTLLKNTATPPKRHC